MSEESGGRAPLASRVLDAVAGGGVDSRTELARVLRVAPSSISQTVADLVARGLLRETGTVPSAGGRPRRLLSVGGADGYAVAADVGSSHVRLGVVRTGGGLSSARTVPFSLADGPRASLDELAARIEEVVDGEGGARPGAVGVALPGPVDLVSGSVALPSRMPGWNGFPARAALAERLGLTVVVENDANLMAFGEHVARQGVREHSITVKAGSAIGAGIIADGRLYRGATGVAGDITHVRVEAAGDRPCSCGNRGCLETVASGAALCRELRAAGLEAERIEDVVALADAAVPEATSAVRRAGHRLGEVLSATVNFFNPDAVYLGGILSSVEPFVAAVRSQLYEGCHPLVTRSLVIERVSLGVDVGVVGAGLLALQRAAAEALAESATPARLAPTLPAVPSTIA